MSEISNTIYVFKKVMKQLMALKKHEAIAKKNTEKIKKGVNINEFINININENEEKKAVKISRTTPWECECGAKLLWGGKKLHIATQKHFTNMKNKPIQVCIVIPEVVIPEVVIPVPKRIIKKIIKKVIKKVKPIE